MIIKKPYVIESIGRNNPDVFTFRFKAQDGAKLEFVPGMFAMVYYRDCNSTQEIGRAYSIANAPPSEYLEFMIAMVHGALTSRLELSKPGDVYYISAPYGQFKFDMNEGKKFLFLAGGTGIAPFFSMTRYARAQGKKLDSYLLYSAKYPNEIIGQKDLDDFADKSDLKVVITVTRPAPGDGWTGQTGHIDSDMIKKYAPDFVERIPYICGPPAFTTAVKQSLMELGFDEKRIKAEMWG